VGVEAVRPGGGLLCRQNTVNLPGNTRSTVQKRRDDQVVLGGSKGRLVVQMNRDRLGSKTGSFTGSL